MLAKTKLLFGSAALAAGILMLSPNGSANAAPLPLPSAPIIQSDIDNSLVLPIHRRAYPHYHADRHGRRYRRRRRGFGHYYDGWWYATPWWGAAVVPIVPLRPVNRRRAHRRWCRSNYASYDGRTNTFVNRRGRVKRCRSPYM